MFNVVLPRRWGSSGIRHVAIWCLGGALFVLSPLLAIGQESPRKTRSSGSEKSEPSKKTADDDHAPAPAPDTGATTVADPSQTRKVLPIEVFKDPAVEELNLLDVKRFKPIVAPPLPNSDILRVKDMAGNANAVLDVPLIDRVVRGLAAKLTDPKNIRALIEPPAEIVITVDATANKAARKKAEQKAEQEASANAAYAKEIPTATADLLEPIFRARSSNHQDFLKAYQRSLNQNLPILLNHHLIPRIQAMIVLGESGSTDAIKIYEDQIKNLKQSLWVKLWAVEGITKTKEHGGVLTTDEESRAAKIVSDFLDKNEDLPWLLQLRGLEALSALRQGYLPTQASKVHMATTAMRFLADSGSKLEVRAEAARARHDADWQFGAEVQLPPRRSHSRRGRSGFGRRDQRALLGRDPARERVQNLLMRRMKPGRGIWPRS